MSSSTTRLKELFSQAIVLPADELPDFLDKVSAECPDVSHRLQRLLAADQRNQEAEFLEWPDSRGGEGVDYGHREHSAVISADIEPLIGRTVAGYQIVERIGAGVTGIIYRAVGSASGDGKTPQYQPQTSEPTCEVAIKVLRSWNHDARGLERFRLEARNLSRIDHPGIAGLLTTGMLDDTPYIVMPFISGRTLNRELDERPETRLETRINWFTDICEAIAAAHQNQVIHRDLKPSNIIITGDKHQDQRAVVVDFGIAKTLDPESTRTGFTRTGELLGTPRFMAPEQFDSARGVNTLADVYGLGAILYYLLTGQPPFADVKIFDVAHSVRNSKPIEPGKILKLQPKEKDLETICLKCLSAEPELRYQSVPELMADVDRWKHNRPIKAKSSPLRRRFRLWIQANPWIAALSTALVLMALLSLVTVTCLWLEAAEAGRIAEEESVRATKTNDQLISILYKQLEFEEGLRDNPAMVEARIDILKSVTRELEKVEQEIVLDEDLLNASAVAWYNLARFEDSFRRGGNSVAEDESRERFEELASRFPENFEHRFSLFHWHNLFGDPNTAYAFISGLVEEEPGNPDYADCFSTACYQRGRAMFVEGRFDSTSELLSIGIETTRRLLRNTSLKNRQFYEKKYIRNYTMRARVNWARNKPAKAQHDIEQAVRWGAELWLKSPDDVEVLMAYADALRFASSAAMCDGEWQEANKFSAGLSEVLEKVLPRCSSKFRLWGGCSTIMLQNWMHAKMIKNQTQSAMWESELNAHFDRWQNIEGNVKQLTYHRQMILLGRVITQETGIYEEMVAQDLSPLPDNSEVRILIAVAARNYSMAHKLLADRMSEQTDSDLELGFQRICKRLIQHLQDTPADAFKPFEMNEQERNFALAYSGYNLQFQLDAINRLLRTSR